MASTVLKIVLAGVLAGATMAALPAAAETPNLTAADRAPCRDPWINYAYRTQFNRSPVGRGDMGECTIQFYAAGKWNSYDQLRNAVVRFQSQLRSRGINIRAANGVYQAFNQAGVVDLLARVVGNQPTVTALWNLVGQLVGTINTATGASSYRLQSTSQQVDLGDGTTLVIR